MSTLADLHEKDDNFENSQDSEFERDESTLLVGTAKRQKSPVGKIELEKPAPDPENNYVSHIVETYQSKLKSQSLAYQYQ